MWTLPIIFCFSSTLLMARRGSDWREAFLVAAVAWGCLVAIFTEALGYFGLLTMGGMALCWAVATAGIVLVNVRLKMPWQCLGRMPGLSAIEMGLAGGVALICLVTLITAILAPPNNDDSLTYHMSRVMHWLQNRSVDHYPTHILRQIEMNPWAEFAITQFQALSGGDRYANLVQWFCMVGSLVGVSLVAEQLGGDRRAQFFATIVAATIPMGILQSSSTQNDYVVAFWLLCLAWAGLKFVKGRETGWAVMIGVSLGLAVLTKGTAYLFAPPFVLWFGWAALRSPPRQAAKAVLCIAIPCLLLNLPHYQRNLGVFGSPLGSPSDLKVASNEVLSPSPLASNLLRNTAQQLATPFEGVNQSMTVGVEQVHKSLGLDVNDPKTSYLDHKFQVRRLSRHEDFSGNFLHVVLAIVVLATLVISRPLRTYGRVTLCYVAAIAAGYLLFCLLVKWQPWGNRLVLPLFVLGTPAVGVIAARQWKPAIVTVSALVLLAAALPWAFSNASRPLVHMTREGEVKFPLLTADRELLYFASAPNAGKLYESYARLASDIRSINAVNIGLVLKGEPWEYPIWVLVREGNPLPVRIEHVEVENESRLIPAAYFKPDYVVRIN